jgi:hypothetical protein
MLPATDRAISRVHSKIIYKNGTEKLISLNHSLAFKIKKPIPPEWIAFLMIFHPRLGSKICFVLKL